MVDSEIFNKETKSKIKRKEFKKQIYMFVFVVCIIGIMSSVEEVYCNGLTLKSIEYAGKTYSVYPDCIKYHVKANGYEKKIKEEVENNFYKYMIGPGQELQTETAKMEGYGNYVMKSDTTLFDFIEYCNSLNPEMTIASSEYIGSNELNSCDYNKLCSYTGQVLTNRSINYVNYFWDNMTRNLGEEFNKYQDLYFFDRFTNKGASLVYSEVVEDMAKKQGKHEDTNGKIEWGHLKYEGEGEAIKVYYKTRDYVSNPMLNDTDFDGIDDNRDSKKINNKFVGNSTDIGSVEYYSDFRWFFTNPSKYNDELAVMSLIASNIARGKTISSDQVSGNIIQYLTALGFTNVHTIGRYNNVYVGKKTIQYYGVKKVISAVIIGDKEDIQIYNTILDSVDKGNSNNGLVNAVQYGRNNITIQDEAESIKNQAFKDTLTDAIWVTGYGVAGSLATEVAKKLTDSGGEVFAYTFGATNTGVGRKGIYSNIKNIINEDDIMSKIINKDMYSRPGQTYSLSIFEDLMREYENKYSTYNGRYEETNYFSKLYNNILTNYISGNTPATIVNRFIQCFVNLLFSQEDMPIDTIENQDTKDGAIVLNRIKSGIKQARDIKSYYILAKNINGFDLTDVDEEKKNKYNKIPNNNVDSSITITGFNDTDIDGWNAPGGKGTKDDPYFSKNAYIGWIKCETKGREKIYVMGSVNGAMDLSYVLPIN